MAVRREYVADLYRNILGREGSDQEIEGHLNNPGGEKGLSDLFNSVAGNKTDGQVNEATVGSTQQQDYQSNYEIQGQDTTRDEWSGEGNVTGGNLGVMSGYDATNWNNPLMQTAKYQVGRIVSRYDLTRPDAINSIMADIKRHFPNAYLVDAKSGRINLGQGDGDVDIIENYGAANARGAWQDRLDAPTGTTRPIGTSGARTSGSTVGTSGARTSGSTVGDLRSLYGALGQQYGGPGGAGITDGPLEQVGQDPLSQLITGALAAFIGNEGKTRFGGDVETALAGLLDRGGELDEGQVARRYESARELLDKGRRTMINDLEGDLVSRNLLAEPGIPQGAHSGGLKRVTEAIAPEFSRALRDIYTDEAGKADARLMTSLQLATGMASDQARNLLASIGEGTARQGALADIALRSLQTNMAWSQFLAEFGLKRDQVMYEMENGNIEQFLPILQAFIQLGGMANQGYV